MKQKGKIIAVGVLVLVIAALAVSALIPHGRNAQESAEQSLNTGSESHRITGILGETMQLDAELQIPSGIDFTTLSVYHAEIQAFDFEHLKELLLSGKTITVEESTETMESLTGDNARFCATEDGFMLSSVGQNLYYSGALFQYVNYAVVSDAGDYSAYESGEELSFASQAEAYAELSELLSELGISTPEEYLCCPMTGSQLEQLYTSRMEDAGFSVDVEDGAFEDCYYFILPVPVADGVLSQQESGVYGDGSYTSGTSIRCVYSKDGIVGLALEYVFCPDSVEESGEGLDAIDAMDILSQKYSTMILEGSYLVDRISFEYVPVPVNGDASSVLLVPAWRFSILHTYETDGKTDSDTETVQARSSVLIHAITGKELAIDSGGV